MAKKVEILKIYSFHWNPQTLESLNPFFINDLSEQHPPDLKTDICIYPCKEIIKHDSCSS